MFKRYPRRTVLEAAVDRNSTTLLCLLTGLALTLAITAFDWQQPARFSAEFLTDLTVLAASPVYGGELPSAGRSGYAPIDELTCGDGGESGFTCIAVIGTPGCARSQALRITSGATGLSVVPLPQSRPHDPTVRGC